MKPIVSVIVPAFNEEDYLPITLQALTKQDFLGEKEIIVVNNNSTDNTESIARSFNTKIIHESQQGLIFAKQAGCSQAIGEYIAVLDADNVPPPDWLGRIVKLLEDPNIAAITGPYRTPSAPYWAKIHALVSILFIELIQALTKNSPHIWGGNVAFRKADFEKIGGYDTKFTFAADEIKLRKDLKKFGRIRHCLKLWVKSSTRRFKQGFFSFYFKFLLKEYLLNYLLTEYFGKKFSPPENFRDEC